LVDYSFGADARNRLAEASTVGAAGAVAALETFYYALNHADLQTLSAVWADDDLVQLNNPVGGIIRSRTAVTDLYGRIFASGIDIHVTFSDAATYLAGGTAAFAGREIGSYRGPDGDRVPIEIRTTRLFGWQPDQQRWAQLHHHGSIDSPEALAAYQSAALHAAKNTRKV
jgi:ketosteroid isomerase-like protein